MYYFKVSITLFTLSLYNFQVVMEVATSDQFTQQSQDSSTTGCGMRFLKTGSKASITGNSFRAQSINRS